MMVGQAKKTAGSLGERVEAALSWLNGNGSGFTYGKIFPERVFT